MTRKKSNVKALALAVTCAILAGGGIGLEPVYAADVTYDTNSYKLQQGGTDIGTLTVGNVTIHGIKENEKPYGITIGDSPEQYVNISNHDVWATGAVHASIIASGVNARIENGKVVAKNGLYIGYTATDVTQATYDNSKFAVNGENGSFKAANGNFKVNNSGAITADSLALTGTDGTTNVGSAIKDNKNAIQAVNGKVTNIQTDVTSLQTTTGQLQTKVGELTDIDTAARNDIISLQKKTAGISEDGSEITTNSLKLSNSASSEEQEITAAKVKGYDVATAAVGNTSTEGTLAYNTQKISYADDDRVLTDKATYIKGITHAGDVRLANGEVRAKSLVLEEDFAGGTSAQATLTRESIVNLHGMIDGKTKIKVADGSEVGGVKFDQGKVTNVTSINDKLEFADDGIYLNKGDQAKQIKIGTDGKIIIGTSSSAYDTNGFYAGGDNYDAAKAGMKSDGSLKATGFAVDGTTGNTTVGGTLDVTGATTLKDTLNVTGKTTLSNELQVNGKATFGSATGANTVIEGDEVKTGRIETNKTKASYIGGVTLHNGQITADSMTIKGNIDLENLKVKNELTVGINTKITEGTLQLGTADDNKLTADKLANINQTIKSGKVIEANSAIIGDVEIKGGDVTTATGTIKGNTISDNGGATLTGGKITAKEGKIGNVEISAAGEVTGVKSIKASIFKVDEENYLNGNGITAKSITAKGGTIGVAVINETTLAVGSTKLDSTDGITTIKLKIGDMTLTGTGLNTGANTFEVNGVKFNQGQVTAMPDKGFVAGNSYFKQGSLIVDANNKLEATNGLTTEKATVKGALDVTGKATFGAAGQQTTIDGKTVTTDTLKANKLILGASGDKTVEVDKDGSLIAAKGKFKVDEDGALKAANGAFNVDKDGKTTFTKDADNLSSINGGNIWAKATDADDHTSSELLHTYKGLHVSGTQAGKTSAFDFDAANGIGTFTGQDGTTTAINGSAITSTNGAATGVLNGSNLTLDDGANSTALTAGGATFTGAAGEKGGTTTTINGGTITTDTLNVDRINLGGEVIDKGAAGVEGNSKLYMDAQGNFRAAGGNFKVTGADGAMTNTVGNTTLKTDNAGASMNYAGTANSNISVADGKAEMTVGANAAVTATDGKVEIKGGTQTVTTTDAGTVFDNGSSAVRPGGVTTTTINGNEITTGKITTDQLVITGQGNADGNGGSIAFGGDGTIKSDINDGQPNGKNTSFETTLDGVNTKVTDGTTTTENQVTAAGNRNTVTNNKDATQKSEFNQGLTSIGGVVTNGTINVAQKLDGATGLLTNEVTNDEGKWSKLEQSGTGLTYTDSAKPDNATRIDSSDVSIGSATNDKDRINLSDLGQIDDLDKEIRDNEVYKKNETAVGGINAEAAIRREEVARLDGRINDVNDRVNKVGAMAAAIASLKSIGYDPQAPSEFSIGLGQYKGETGVAMGFFHYPNKNFMINVSLSTAGGETMGGIGATWRFGHKSPQKLLEEQREAQAKKELAAAEKYQAAAKLAKEAQERAEYAAKLARQAQVSADNAKAAADATQAKHFG